MRPKNAVVLAWLAMLVNISLGVPCAKADGFYYAGYMQLPVVQQGFQNVIVSNYAQMLATAPGYFPLNFSFGNKTYTTRGVNFGKKWFSPRGWYYVLDAAYANAVGAIATTLMGGIGWRFALSNTWSISPFGMLGEGRVETTFPDQPIIVFGGASTINLNGTLGKTYTTGEHIGIQTKARNHVRMVGVDIERPWATRLGIYVRLGWLTSGANQPTVHISGKKAPPSIFFARNTAFSSTGNTPNTNPFQHARLHLKGPVVVLGALF